MQTIGQLLKSYRISHNLTIKQLSEKTKIADYLLNFLEKDQFDRLPSNTFTKGLIKNYAKAVNLQEDKALAIFRRDFVADETGKIIPRGLVEPLDKPILITSNWIWRIGALIFIVLFVGFLFWQLKNFNAPPKLYVSRPQPNTILMGPIISVKGSVSADASVYVNGQLAEIFPTGEFRTAISLPSGKQQITVKAVDGKNHISSLNIPVEVENAN